MKKSSFFTIIVLILILFEAPKAQSRTNLEVFYSLTDSVTNEIISELDTETEKIYLVLNLGESYSLFSNHIKTAFNSRGIEIIKDTREGLPVPTIDIVIENAGVEYNEMFRDGWFGDHLLTRNCNISGNYLNSFTGRGKIVFNFSNTDTVKVEEVEKLESESFPFTKNTLPEEPFLSGLVEPIIAIGTAAAIIILFFTVRSSS